MDMSTLSFCVSAGGSVRSSSAPSAWPLSFECSLKSTSPRISSYRKRKPFSSRPPRSSSPWRSQLSSCRAASRPTSAPSGRVYEMVCILLSSAPMTPSSRQLRSRTASKSKQRGGSGSATRTLIWCDASAAETSAWHSVRSSAHRRLSSGAPSAPSAVGVLRPPPRNLPLPSRGLSLAGSERELRGASPRGVSGSPPRSVSPPSAASGAPSTTRSSSASSSEAARRQRMPTWSRLRT